MLCRGLQARIYHRVGLGIRLFQQKRIFEALDALEKAGAIFEASPEVYNLRGSCYVEMRAFDKALREFGEASALSKDNPSIEFNIAEVLFVTRQWQKFAFCMA
jgi:Flp pilus assembly protein TadD